MWLVEVLGILAMARLFGGAKGSLAGQLRVSCGCFFAAGAALLGILARPSLAGLLGGVHLVCQACKHETSYARLI